VTQDEQNIIIKLVEYDDNTESIKLKIAGDIPTLTRMLYSGMLNNEFLTTVVLNAAQAYQTQDKEAQKIRLN
jgi:hypothetical protein